LAYRITRKAKYGADKFVLIGRDKIHYLEAGQGTPVIMIPGSYSTYRVWVHLMPLLAGSFRLLVPDFPPDKELTIREQSDLIAQMARQLKLGKVNLVGGAQGGATVFEFAARYPDLTGKIISIAGDLVHPDELKADPKKSKNKPEIQRASALRKEAKNIKTPVMYLYGTNIGKKETTLAKNLEFLQKDLPLAWIVALEGGVFETALKNPQEVANLILDFFKAPTKSL
jgi:pimeloyl-ACP methyl ester carboxylesterase